MTIAEDLHKMKLNFETTMVLFVLYLATEIGKHLFIRYPGIQDATTLILCSSNERAFALNGKVLLASFR